MHSFELFSILPGVNALPAHVFHGALVFVILTTLVLVANRRLTSPDLDIVPAAGRA